MKGKEGIVPKKADLKALLFCFSLQLFREQTQEILTGSVSLQKLLLFISVGMLPWGGRIPVHLNTNYFLSGSFFLPGHPDFLSFSGNKTFFIFSKIPCFV